MVMSVSVVEQEGYVYEQIFCPVLFQFLYCRLCALMRDTAKLWEMKKKTKKDHCCYTYSKWQIVPGFCLILLCCLSLMSTLYFIGVMNSVWKERVRSVQEDTFIRSIKYYLWYSQLFNFVCVYTCVCVHECLHTCVEREYSETVIKGSCSSTKTECDYLYGWIKKRSHIQKSHQNWWTQELQLGTQKKKKRSCS